MLIVCPACASEYEIAVDRLGASGRSVRCAACRETWFIAPEVVESAADAVERTDEPTADDSEGAAEAAPASTAERSDDPGVVDQTRSSPRRRRPAAKKPRRSRPGRVIPPALAAGLAVLAILPLALLGRSTVVGAMPQTAALFASVGLPVNLRGVAIRDVVAFQTAAEGDKPGELVVEGDLTGVARDRVDVPDLAIEVRDAHDQPVHRWTIPAPRAALDKAETARFKASLSAPPANGRSVQVRFAQAKAAETERAAAPAEPAAHGSDAQHSPAHGH